MTKAPAALDRLRDQAAERVAPGWLLAGHPVPERLNSGDTFAEASHRDVFEAVQGLTAAGSPVDLLSVEDFLRRKGSVIPYELLDELHEGRFAGTLLMAVGTLTRLAQRRELVRLARVTGEAAAGLTLDDTELLGRLQNELSTRLDGAAPARFRLPDDVEVGPLSTP